MASGSADGRLLLQTAGPRRRKMGRSCNCRFDVSWANNHSFLKLNKFVVTTILLPSMKKRDVHKYFIHDLLQSSHHATVDST